MSTSASFKDPGPSRLPPCALAPDDALPSPPRIEGGTEDDANEEVEVSLQEGDDPADPTDTTSYMPPSTWECALSVQRRILSDANKHAVRVAGVVVFVLLSCVGVSFVFHSGSAPVSEIASDLLSRFEFPAEASSGEDASVPFFLFFPSPFPSPVPSPLPSPR